MIQKLKQLQNNSYAPYSKVNVMAVVVDKNNNEYDGVNVENAAFGSTICAERSALVSAVSAGVKPGEVKELHLSSSLDIRLFPCGACLQFMLEILNKDTPIYIYKNDDVKKFTLNDLVPYGVTKGDFNWK